MKTSNLNSFKRKRNKLKLNSITIPQFLETKNEIRANFALNSNAIPRYSGHTKTFYL